MPVSKIDERFDLIFWDGKLIESPQVGRHHLCNGFIHKRRISPKHYVLFCGGCGLRIKIPERCETKDDLLAVLMMRKALLKGKEEISYLCPECEGSGRKDQDDFKEYDTVIDNFPKKGKREVKETIVCSNCQGSGIIQKVKV